LALTICGHAALPPALKITNQMWLSVTCPNPWNPNVDAYQLVDILQLVIFYNDDLGINAGDLVYVMRQKKRSIFLFMHQNTPHLPRPPRVHPEKQGSRR